MTNNNPNHNTSSSQCAAVLAHLRAGNGLTALQALNQFGCARLAARIDDLRSAGHRIETIWLRVANRARKTVRVAEYRLANEVAA